MDEYKSKILKHKDMGRVINAIFEAALDPDAKDRAVAWKMLMDRAAPAGAFTSADKASGNIQINISTVDAKQVSGEVIEGEVVDQS